MQINVAVTDANNIVCQVVPPQTEVITIDRGVAGNGIVSIVPVTISTFQYLRITYTNGTVQDVGPLTSTAYTATSPITIVGNTISLATVPIASGGTDATTAAGAIQNLLPSYTGNANKRLGLNSGGTGLEWVADGGGTVTSIAASGGSTGLTFSGSPITSSGTLTLGGTLAVASGGTGATTAADARTNLSAAYNAITISAGTGLTGGGDLTANRTLSIDSSVVTLTGTQTLTNKTLTSPKINEILDTNGNEILGLSPTASATDFVTIKNGIGVGVPLHIYADGSSASIGLHIQPKGTGLVTISDGTDFNKGIRFRSSGSAASAVTLLDAVSTAGRVVTLPDATTTLVGRDTTDTLTNKTIAFASNTFTGALSITNGGTGQTTANAALNALLPTQTGNASKYLQTDGTNATWDAISLSTADITGILPTANGGTGLSSFTANGVVYASSTSALTTGSALSFDASTLKLAANNTSYRGQLTIEGGASDFAQITFYRGSTTNTDQVGYLHSSNSGSTGIALGARNGAILRFEVGDSERARITASGELLVGRTSSSGLGQIQSTIGADLATDSGSVYLVRGGGNVGISTTSLAGLKLVALGATGYPATSGVTQTGVFRITGGTGLYNVLDMGVNESTDTAWMQATRANSLGTYDKLVINPYGGNVAIGTTTASYKLHVAATAVTAGYFTSSAAATTLTIDNSNANAWGGNLAIATQGTNAGYFGTIGSLLGTTSQDLAVWATAGNGFRVYTNGNNLRATFDISGNLGLGGTTTAYNNARLTVVTPAVSGRQNLSAIDKTTTNWVRFTNPQFSTDSSMGLILKSFPDSDSRQGAGIIASGGATNNSTNLSLFVTDSAATSSAAYTITPSGTDFVHAWNKSAGSEAMTLISTGLGIGTSSPQARIDFGGSTDQSFYIYNASSDRYGMDMKQYDSQGYGTNIFAGNGGYIKLRTASGSSTPETRLTITPTGDVGIGTSSPSSALYVKRTSGNSGIYTDYNGTNVGRIEAASNGNLYIGTTTGSGSISIGNTANPNAVVLDYSSNLLVGATSLASGFSTYAQIEASGTTGGVLINSGASQIGRLIFTNGNTSGNEGLIRYDGSNNSMQFWTNASERARIDSSGNLLVGTTSILDGNSARIAVGFTYPRTGMEFQSTTSSSLYQITFRNTSTGLVGSITSDTTSTSYNTSSDYRLKNTIAPMTGALAKIALLKPCTYKWNANGADGEGFIAHELAEVFPQAVSGEKDAVDSNGNIKPQGIDTSFLVATLTAAIQELKAEFDAYKASHP
jgi:hypothetical protein